VQELSTRIGLPKDTHQFNKINYYMNKDTELHQMIQNLNQQTFDNSLLTNQPEQWHSSTANEVRELREQQEKNWWLDKQYEWMKKHGGKEDTDPESIALHLENAEEIRKCKIEVENKRGTNPLEAILLVGFFIFLFLAS
jgi:hypothetical protein